MSLSAARFSRLALFGALLVGAALLAGCGASETAVVDGPIEQQKTCDNTLPPEQQDPDCATVLVEITDADGDFLSYSVDVVSLKLRRADGAEVETLPIRTRIDFAQYVELTELLTAASVPSGVYVGGSIRLDYSSADLQVERGGEAAAAAAYDEDGNLATELELALALGESERLVVAPGVPARLTLDFDLDASHEVDLAPTPVAVTVRPTLVAGVDRDMDRPQRVRGPLLDADPVSSSYVVALRPFHLPGGHFGRFRVTVNDATAWEIDGTAYVGAAGLEALDAKLQGTATLALGAWDSTLRAYVASEVYAGSSVPGGTLDAVEGNVFARSGMTLTVKGATLVRATGTAHFNDTVTVTLADDVVVRRAGEDAALDAQAISVGQRVLLMGQVTSTPDDPLAFTAGYARLKPTHLQATVVAAQAGLLVADLHAIDRRRADQFDFAGTGTVAATDADPDAYEIELGELSGAGLELGEPVGVIGFVRPFGGAPADFEARTVIDYSESRAHIALGFGADGTTSPFTVIADSGLTLDVADPAVGVVHHLRRGGVLTDLRALVAAPQIVPAEEGVYAIRAGSTVTAHGNFADFVADLTAHLNAGGAVLFVHASGQWDDTTATLAAHSVIVIMP